MSNLYVHPGQNAFAKLFLIDKNGKYLKWPRSIITVYGRWGRMALRLSNNNLALGIIGRHEASCRETLCNSFNDFLTSNHLNNICESRAAKVTCEPPKAKSGRPLIKDTSAFVTRIGGSVDGKKKSEIDLPGASKLYKQAYKLATTKKCLTEVYALMDIIMGTAALLMGGPSAYVRTLVSKNPVTVGVPKKADYMVVNRVTYAWDTHTTTEAKVRLQYNGLSNFWVAHPASLSILAGLSRMCVELWFDGKYSEIDDEVDVVSLRRWLATMAKKRTFTATDKEELLEVLEWFKPYFESKKVLKNPGAYPINKWTYDMFIKYCGAAHTDKPVTKEWEAESGVYGLVSYGFLTWCRKQQDRTTKFERRPKDRDKWDGLNGEQVSLYGS